MRSLDCRTFEVDRGQEITAAKVYKDGRNCMGELEDHQAKDPGPGITFSFSSHFGCPECLPIECPPIPGAPSLEAPMMETPPSLQLLSAERSAGKPGVRRKRSN